MIKSLITSIVTSTLIKRLFGQSATALRMLYNKGAAAALFLILIFQWSGLADAPFAELLYAVILVGTVIVTAPVIRLLVFPSAASIAEKGELPALLKYSKVEPALMHYWIATVISYAVTLICVSSLI